MSYTTTYTLDADDAVLRVNRSPLDGIVRLDVDDDPDIPDACAYLTPEEAIRLGRALIAAAGPTPYDTSARTLNVDDALRSIRDTVGRAFANGATLDAVLERVVLAYRNLSLGGPAERSIVAATATAIREEPTA